MDPRPSADALDALVRRRRAVRHFRPDPLPEGALHRLAEAARWAPSGYNLQPIHLICVRSAEVRQRLRPACMGQAQVTEAPAVFVVVGDREVAGAHLEDILRGEREAGRTDDAYERTVRGFVGLAFGTGPWGLGRLAKALGGPLRRLVVPTPSIPAVHRRYWLAKQGGLAAMNLMLAATSLELGSCPMEGFDEPRVRRVLGLSRRYVPLLVIPVGHPVSPGGEKSRLPAERLVHLDRFGGGPLPEGA